MTATTTKQPFVPSVQQTAVLDWVSNGRGNAFVEAVAGAGKTTTLVQACLRMRGSVGFAAFNKKIATDISAKLEEAGVSSRDVKAGTFHSFGFNAWRRAHPSVKVDANRKATRMLEENQVHDDLRGIVTKLVSLAKQSGVELFWQSGDTSKWYDIVNHHDLTAELEEPEDIGIAIDVAKRCLKWSRDIATTLIDFDDMIWLPIITDVRIWQNDWVLVDEAQDTNPARRALARRMLRPNGRIIFVGDRHQAIYGFTGADNDAIEQIIRDFKCSSLPLTMTYRCPQSVTAEAQQYVSHITAHPSAPEGLVRAAKAADFIKVEVPAMTPADAILCRLTKPLVSLAFRMLRAGIACHVEGRDIGQGLIKLATRWKSAKTTEELRDRLEDYKEREVAKLQAKGLETAAEALMDRIDTLLVIGEGCDTVRCIVEKIEHMFRDTDDGNRNTVTLSTVTLSTVHKAKGREWDRVFILGFSKYMPSPWARQAWQHDQETNLIYVAITRSQRELVYVEALED